MGKVDYDVYRLPATEEEFLVSSYNDVHGGYAKYRTGWAKGRMYACNKIVDYVKLKGYPANKEAIIEMIKFITER